MKITSLLIFLCVLVSCRNKGNLNTDSNPSSSISINEKSKTDSLDLDSSHFLTSNFPDTIKDVLEGSNDSAWMCITAFYMENKTRELAIESFTMVMTKSHFIKDTTAHRVRFWKNIFNRRFGVEIKGGTIDTISAISQIWYAGSRYELITHKYKYW